MGTQQPTNNGSSPAPIDPLLLQAYFDGELDAEETARIAALLQDAPEDGLRLEALGEMRELVRFELEQQIEDVDLSVVWERVAPALEPARRAPIVAAAEPGWLTLAWRSVPAFFAAHRAVLVPVAVAAVLVALVTSPMVMNQQPHERVVEKERTIVIVEPLRFEGGSTGAVSYTPESNTPVIWYLGGASSEPNAVMPAAADRDRLPDSVQKILERLERLEKLGWPSEPPAVQTPTAPPTTSPALSPDGPI